MSSKKKTTEKKEDGKIQPRLRFPEFQNAGEWVKMSIQEMIDKALIIGHLDGNHGELYPKAEEFSSNKEGIPYISANDFMNGSVEFFRCKRLPIARARIFKKGVAKDGDILFAHNATVGPVAKLNTEEEFVILSTTATYFRCNGELLSNDFLKSALSSPEFVCQYSRVMSQSTRNQVPITTQRKLDLHIPKLPEQQRIADCLTSLDDLIAAQTQKLEAFKTHKKGLMQQLFPREGETQPRLRFPEFQNAGEWVEKRTDEWGDVLAGKALAVNAPGPLRPYLRTKNVLDGAIDVSDVLTMPMTDAEFSRFEVLDGDILLNEGQSLGLVGRASIYRGEFGRRCAMQNALLRFRAFPSTCPEFAAQAFCQCQKDGTFASIATQTTSVAHLGSSRFSALGLAWPPSLAEQQRIASCLSSLDALITAATQKLEALKTHKRGLMQQLFPSPEGIEP